MSDTRKLGEAITIPTEEEQEAITGGRVIPGETDGSGKTVNPALLHEPTRPKWDPGGPPQMFKIRR